MTREDKEELKELLHDYIKGVIAREDAKFDIIDFKLDSIKEQTTRTNGRVTRLEEKESNHILNCPIAPKVRVLEDQQLSTRSVKVWLFTAVSITGVVVTIIFAVFKMFSNT